MTNLTVATKTAKQDAAQAEGLSYLLPGALYSWNEIAPFVGIGRGTWHRRTKEGTAPQPIVMGSRCTRYRGSDVLAWITSPNSYRVNSGTEQ